MWYEENINIVDKYESNGYNNLKLIEYNVSDPVLKTKNKKKNKKSGTSNSDLEIENLPYGKKTIYEKINKNIKVTFIKDVKGKTYVKNPFPDHFLIENNYNCKCYIPVEYNNIDKIKLYLVNPKNKNDWNIRFGGSNVGDIYRRNCK